MYYPPNFDRERAVELCKLIIQARTQLYRFLEGKPWKLVDGYTLICEIYHASLERDDELTLIDKESRYLERKKRDLHIPMGFVAQREGNAYLVFRGAHTLGEWTYDFNLQLKPYPYLDNVTFHADDLILLKGDRQIPVSGADLAVQSRDLAIPGEQTRNGLRM